MDKPTAIISNHIYIPLKLANRPAIAKHLHVHHFDEKTCDTCGPGRGVCENKPDRPNETCGVCPAYAGLFKFYDQKTIKGVKYVGIAKGSPSVVEKVTGGLENYDIVDKRFDKRMTHPLRMVENFLPRKHQPGAVKALAKVENGVLVAPARSGKSLIMVMLGVKLKRKMLILAHQDDLIDQIYASIMGDTKADPPLEAFTNGPQLEDEFGGGTVARICKSPKDWLSDADILLGTYHQFIRNQKARKLLSKVCRTRGVTIIDEGHKIAAAEFAKTITAITTKRVYTVTATFNRKDGKIFVVKKIVGDIVHKCKIEVLKPTVTAHISKSKAQVKAQNWTNHMKGLSKNEVRRREIVAKIISDIKEGHSVIVACAAVRVIIDDLVKDINIAWMNDSGSTDQIAAAFYRYQNPAHKKKVLQDAREGKLKVVVAMRSMLTGVDVPIWSCFHQYNPSNNEPNWEQESKRVCTPMPKGKEHLKPKPIIRMWVDLGSGASMSCFNKTVGFSKTLNYDIHKSVGQVMEEVGKKTGTRYSDQRTTGLAMIGKPGKQIRL